MSVGGGVELQVTNLDPGIDQRDVRQLISNLFEEYISIQGVNVYRQDGGGVGAWGVNLCRAASALTFLRRFLAPKPPLFLPLNLLSVWFALRLN